MAKYKVDKLDLIMLKSVNGRRYSTEVEFEEKTRLRTLLAYGVKSYIDDSGILRVDFESFSS